MKIKGFWLKKHCFAVCQRITWNIIFTSDDFPNQLAYTVTGELGIDNQQIFIRFMYWVVFLNDEFVTVELKKPAYFYCSTKRAIEVESLIIKDAYNTRIGLKLIDILYRSTSSYYKQY